MFNEGKRGKSLSFGELLIAAGISGMPAAYLTTPFGKDASRVLGEKTHRQMSSKPVCKHKRERGRLCTRVLPTVSERSRSRKVQRVSLSFLVDRSQQLSSRVVLLGEYSI